MNEDMKLIRKHVTKFKVNITHKYRGANYDEKTLEAVRVEATAFADWITGMLNIKHTALIWGVKEMGIIQLKINAITDDGMVIFARIETKEKPNVPTIRDAKILAEKYGQDGVVVFFFKGEQYGFSSFGMDRKQCEKFGVFGNRVADLIESGDIKI